MSVAELLLNGALELVEPLVSLIRGVRRVHAADSGDYYRARMRLELSGYIRCEPDLRFRCVLEPSTLVQVTDERFAANGDTLVRVHSLSHEAD